MKGQRKNKGGLPRRSRRRSPGQAMLEFMVIIVVIFFFLFFMVSLSILFVVSDYIEYATFMAARTYKSGFSSEERQLANATFVFQKYFEKVDGIARLTSQPTAVEGTPGDQQSAGIRVTYDIPLFYLPPVFDFNPIPSRLPLAAEAHLGRDPAFREVCDPDNPGSFFNTFLQEVGVNAGPEIAEQMDDNGC